jgi:hypothetical protein
MIKPQISCEDDLQRAMFDHYRWRAEADSILAHIPNGGARNAIVGAKLKGLGVVPGIPDNFALGDVPFFLELKNPKFKNPMSKLSPEQREIMAKMQAKGIPVYVSGCLDEVIEILERHQVLRAAK